MDDILKQLKVISDKQKELAIERNKILKENELTWSLEKCREMKCKHIKGRKTDCGARGIEFFCIHDWVLPFQRFGVVINEYKKEVKEKEEIVMTGIKHLIGGFGKNKNRFNTVIKETPKYYKLDNGDRIRKDTMWTDMGSTQWQNFNYHVRVATEEEIKQNVKEE